MNDHSSRVDLLLVADMIEKGARVLDVGCGDGSLLQILTDQRQVDGRGIELSQSGVNGCVAKGLSVIQGDADTDLIDYPDDAFDYVILSQTLQTTGHCVFSEFWPLAYPRPSGFFGPDAGHQKFVLCVV